MVKITPSTIPNFQEKSSGKDVAEDETLQKHDVKVICTAFSSNL
jgi:hypothetical protein